MLSAVLGQEAIGYIEVDTIEPGERLSRRGGWADIGNLHVAPGHRRRGVGTWLLGQADTSAAQSVCPSKATISAMRCSSRL